MRGAEVAMPLQADGCVHGSGPGYDLAFTERAFFYTPALGPRTGRALPLRYELLAVGRGAADHLVEPAHRTMEGQRICFERTGVVEA